MPLTVQKKENSLLAEAIRELSIHEKMGRILNLKLPP